ncbi:hypothetical protein M9Y10_011203 [Tritrichomonas musculus]|uniref:Tubulin--tyrosine ligase-like protein 5 n=1 Tax=Tritrichomonas musculus TaxID=1915356 RepID=A0ABR2IJZ6_9EUKA
MKKENEENERKTVLSPDLLLQLYKLYQKKDPLPYSYIRIPGERSLNKRQHAKFFANCAITCVARDVMKHSGIYEANENDTTNNWNCSWGFPFFIDDYKKFEPWQKINHFCGDFLLGKKSELDYRMEELFPHYPELSNFYPLTFSLPRNQKEFKSAISSRRYWIFKPNHSDCGKYVQIYDTKKRLSSLHIDFKEFKGVVQEYIDRPLTIFGRKFDLRIYVLVTSLRPLRIYMNTQGLARFCPKPYSLDNLDNGSHLTNFTLHKDDPDFVFSNNSRSENVNNCKWSLRFFLSFLSEQKKIDVSYIIKQIEKIIVTTLITAGTSIRICQESITKHRKLCYELFGFDILIDEKFHCHLLEVNMKPNMSGLSSLLDYYMKYSVILDMLRLANIIDFDLDSSDEKKIKLKNDIENYEKKFAESISSERRKAVELNELNPWDDPVFADFEIVRDLIDELVRKSSSSKKAASVPDYFDINDELKISKCKKTENDEDFKGTFSEEGHFRLIYPTPKNADKYSSCFDVLRYEDIVLHKWMLMSEEEKLKIIQSHFNGCESKYY